MNFTDPVDDRAKILSLKPRLITATCDWIITTKQYKEWRNIRTRSQLLWVSGGQARGKTMLAIFLTQEFDRLAKEHGEITVLYYFIDRQDKRDTAVHILRGLILRLVAVRKALIQHLVEEYDDGTDLFGPNSIEQLWRVFEAMIRDPASGQVYCVLDGLDACTEDSLKRLIGRIRDFFLDEPQTIVDEVPYSESYSAQAGASRSPRHRAKGDANLKMMLVSREEPEWLKDLLGSFPRVPLGGSSKKTDYSSPYNAKAKKKAPKLADIAASILRKQTLDKMSASQAATPGPSTTPADTQVAVFSPFSSPPASQSPYQQSILTSGAISLSSGTTAPNDTTTAYSPLTSASTPSALTVAGSAQTPNPYGSATSQDISSHPASAGAVAASHASATVSPLPAAASSPLTSIPAGSSQHPTSTEASTSYLPASFPSTAPAFTSPNPGDSAVTASSLPVTVPCITPSPTAAVSDIANSSVSIYSSTTTNMSSTLPNTSLAQPTPPPAYVLPEDPANVAPADSKKPVPPSPAPVPAPGCFLGGTGYTEEPSEYPQEKPPVKDTNGEEEHEDHELHEDDEDYNPSLRVYIEAKIEDLAHERHYSTALQSFICAALEFRGDGTFLWVDFAIEELKRVKAETMEETINSFPSDLEEMYCRVLRMIPPHLVDLVIGLLRWTVCARRPLDLPELTVALNLSHLSPNDAMAFILGAITACGHLITVGEEDLSVNLVHISLVELLTDEDSPLLKDAYLSKFHIRPGQIDGEIAAFCISYIESGPFDNIAICQYENQPQYDQHVTNYPFLRYAASFWTDHLKEATNPYLNLHSPFFQPKSKSRKHWFETYWAFTTGRGIFFSPSDFTLLHLAAYFGLVSLAQQLAHTGQLPTRLNKRDSHGMTPLEYSVAEGHIPMFMFLIQHNAKQEPIGESVLELACRKNQPAMVNHLLNMGWDVNFRARPTGYGSTLYSIVRYLPGFYYEGMEMSRDAWHMVFRDTGLQETPLHVACTYGHTAVVELLLEHGADVNAGTTKGFTSLMCASYNGHIELVHLLQERGAILNAATTDYWLAMHYAAMRGKLDVVEFYIDNGIPVDAMTNKSKSALHLTSWAGHIDVAKFLLAKGANIELRSYKGETPLHLATRHFAPWMVELLLTYGADRNAMNNAGLTPLQWALASKAVAAQECVRILQTFGMEGYVPWQPPEQPNNAAPVQTPQATGQSQASDAGARRSSTTFAPPPPRSFGGHSRPPRTNTFGFEAQGNITVQAQPNQAPVHGNVQATTPQPTYSGAQPDFQKAHAEPAGVPESSKFQYDPSATMHQNIPGVLNGSASPPSGPPPPYSATATGSPPTTFPEKSPAWTAQFNQTYQGTLQPLPLTPVAQSAQTSLPVKNWNTGTGQAPSQPLASSSSSIPQPTQQAVSPEDQTGLAGRIGSLSMASSPSATSPIPAIELPGSVPSAQTSTQVTQPSCTSPTPHTPYQTPTTPILPAATPTPLMSPFKASATPVNSSYQHAAAPVQQFPPQQPRPQPACPMQPQPTQVTQQFVQPSPMQPIYNQAVPFQTPTTPAPAPTPFTTPPAQPQAMPTNPYLTPQPTPASYLQSPQSSQPMQQPMQPMQVQSPQPMQPYQPTPVQSPYFSGNSTASTYNSTYEYSAPPINAPYNPNIGNVGVNTQQYGPPFGGPPGEQPGGWQGQPNNGMLFAPPPPPNLAKRKSFLGGLINK